MMALSGVRISWLILARNSDFWALAASAARRAAISSSSTFFQCVMSRSTAQYFARLAEPADGHEQRDQPAARHLADHLAAVVEHARDAVRGEPVDIVERRLPALLGEEVGERRADHVRSPRRRTAPRRLRLMRAMRPSPSMTRTPSVAVSRIVSSSRRRPARPASTSGGARLPPVAAPPVQSRLERHGRATASSRSRPTRGRHGASPRPSPAFRRGGAASSRPRPRRRHAGRGRGRPGRSPRPRRP